MSGIPSPSWLLLFWCGLAAALASELLAAALRPPRTARRRGQTSSPQLITGPRENLPIAVAASTLLAAPIYGVIFEVIARARFLDGMVIGAIHGTIVAAVAMLAGTRSGSGSGPARPAPRAMAWYRVRRLIARVAWGAIFGFLYVVPGSSA